MVFVKSGFFSDSRLVYHVFCQAFAVNWTYFCPRAAAGFFSGVRWFFIDGFVVHMKTSHKGDTKNPSKLNLRGKINNRFASDMINIQ